MVVLLDSRYYQYQTFDVQLRRVHNPHLSDPAPYHEPPLRFHPPKKPQRRTEPFRANKDNPEHPGLSLTTAGDYLRAAFSGPLRLRAGVQERGIQGTGVPVTLIISVCAYPAQHDHL